MVETLTFKTLDNGVVVGDAVRRQVNEESTSFDKLFMNVGADFRNCKALFFVNESY